nr:DUF5057 domain-containing protein [Saccharibacillus deserti]
MNDITKLKSGQIENAYIRKGLPVIFHTSIAAQSPSGNLYALYSKYSAASTQPGSVKFVDDSTLISDVAQAVKDGNALYKQRPRIEVTAKPDNFLDGSNRIYTTGDKLTFTFNANNVKDFNTPVNAKLYASVDKVFALSNDNIVASSTLTARSGKLAYNLPQTFSGPIYWKLELTANGLNDYAEGAFRVHDKQTVIRVLQILPNSDASSLLKETNMNSSYLRTSDYDIQITPVLFSSFNTKGSANSYANLNGKYDMLIFGFMDNYNSQTASNLSDDAAASVNAFIKTGQAVMFTHDTMIGDRWNPWIRNFQQTTGQTGLYTNMGLGAPNKSIRTQVVNNGMLTQFPFDLSQKPGNTGGFVGQIAQTHDQYYMLDLEDPEIVPWYNIVSESGDANKRDSEDSYNHYYTYSKGNVTYSGTGHTNIKFPEWEQKLFVNTMFRAFIGSNHAPTISVLAPTADETTKPSYLKDLVFSYQVDDLDLYDLNMYASVRFKVNGSYVDEMTIAEKPVSKGSVITEKFKNPLLLKEGKIEIEIKARDKQGATAVKTIDLTMKKVSANLLTERTLDTVPANYEFMAGSKVGMTYTVTPQTIPAADIRTGESGLNTLEISNIKYSEKMPAGLEIQGALPAGLTKTGTAAEGYTLAGSFDKIRYTLDGNSYVPNKDSGISFHLDVVPTQKGSYNLNQAKLDYEDLHASSPYAAPLQQLQKYSLIVLGNSPVNLAQGQIKGGVAVNGSVTTSATIGGELDSSVSSVALVTNGNLTLSGGTISKGAILAKGNVEAPGFAFSEFTRAVIGGDVKFGYGSGDAAKMSYGGTYSGPGYLKPAPVKGDAEALKNEIGRAFSFSETESKLTALSSAYASMPSNGTRQPASGSDSGGVITLTGADPDLNVFDLNSADTVNMNDLKIIVPAGASAVVNVSGGALRLSNIVSADPARTLINYTGTDTLYVGNAPVSQFPKGGNGSKVDGSVLAPYATVNYENGNGAVYGAIVAKNLVSSGSITLHRAPFAGAEPPSEPVPGEPRTVQFPDVLFNAIVKTQRITMPDQALWVDDSTALVPAVTLSDGTIAEHPPLIWSSSDPSVQIIYPEGTQNDKADSITVKGLKAGQAVITAAATDGSGVTGTATVSVEAPAILIAGSPSVNVGQTIEDIRLTTNASNLRIDRIVWEVAGDGREKVDLNPQADPSSLFVTGLQSGSVTLRATVYVTNTRTNTSKVLDAHHDLIITDRLSSIQIEGPSSVLKGGTIDLNTVILPAEANIGSIVWSLANGADQAKLTPVTPAQQQRPTAAVLEGVAPGPVTVSVTVRTAGDNPSQLTQTKQIWVLDFAVRGGDTVYVGDSIDFDALVLPAEYPGAKEAVRWSVADIQDSGPFTGPYASLGTPSTDGNKISLAGQAPGKVTLTAILPTPAGDLTAVRQVTVKPVVTALLLPPTIRVEKGVPFDLIAGAPLMVNPISISARDIKDQLVWSVADKDIAVVDPNGIVTGLLPGREAVVTVLYQRTPTSDPVQASTRIIVAKPADPNAPGDGDRY